MAYDTKRRRVVLFGGSSGASETWEWDGQSWQQRCLAPADCGAIPTPLTWARLTYDRAFQPVVAGGLACLVVAVGVEAVVLLRTNICHVFVVGA